VRPSARFSSARRLCQLPSAMPAAQAAERQRERQARGRKEYPASMLRYFGDRGVRADRGDPVLGAGVHLPGTAAARMRAVKALALRVGLSLGLFLFLMARVLLRLDQRQALEP